MTDLTISRPYTVISYPKSGRTWLRYMLNLADIQADFRHVGYGASVKSMGLRFSGVKPEFIHNQNTIFLHRNPIDTAVSLYFHIHHRKLKSLQFQKFFILPYLKLQGRFPPTDMYDFLCHPGFGVENICLFNRTWIDYLSNNYKCRIISYEQMRQNPQSSLDDLFRFWNYKPTLSTAEIVEASSFDKMSALEKREANKELRLGRTRSSDPDSGKVRRGKINGYIDYLHESQINHLKSICEQYDFIG